MSDFSPSMFPPLGPATSVQAIDPQGWDRCTLAGNVIPGFCRIVRGSVRLKIQRKRAKGSDGENPTFCGMDPQPIELEIMTFSDNDREELSGVVGRFIPIPGKAPDPVSIDHPSLRMLGISLVIFTGMSALMNVGPMRARMTIEMLHWLPASKKVAVKTFKGAPTRKFANNRATENESPTQQPGFGGPPPSLHQNP